MIGLEEYKEALGEVDDIGLTEEEIIKARQIQDDLAENFYVMWLENIQQEKKKAIPSNIYLQKNDEIKQQ
jgi:hypothetical protein